MRVRFVAGCLAVAVLSVAPPVNAADQPWLRAFGRETIVCVSPKAEDAVRRAAAAVVETLRREQPPAQAFDPDRLISDYPLLGGHHVIVVGQWDENIVLRATWGFWATTKAQRQWQAKGDEIAREALGLWERDVPPLPWRYRHELFAFGYGDFDGPDVGYIQTVRNPYTLLMRLGPGQPNLGRPTAEKPKTEKPPLRVRSQPPDDQMRFIIHLTGTGPEGVQRAVEAFLDRGLLNGVVPGTARPLLDDWTLEGLGPAQLRADLPSWAPTRDLPDGVQYAGRQMPGSHLYGGFMQAAQVRPVRCWRLKYRVRTGFVLYDSYPTNRASGNEVFIAEMATPADAAAAAKALEAQYRGHVAVRERYVLMHSFSGKDGSDLLRSATAK